MPRVIAIDINNNNNNNINSNNNNNGKYVIIRLIKNAKCIFCYLACHGNERPCSKEKKSVFYFLIKVSDLNLF